MSGTDEVRGGPRHRLVGAEEEAATAVVRVAGAMNPLEVPSVGAVAGILPAHHHQGEEDQQHGGTGTGHGGTGGPSCSLAYHQQHKSVPKVHIAKLIILCHKMNYFHN